MSNERVLIVEDDLSMVEDMSPLKKLNNLTQRHSLLSLHDNMCSAVLSVVFMFFQSSQRYKRIKYINEARARAF